MLSRFGTSTRHRIFNRGYVLNACIPEYLWQVSLLHSYLPIFVVKLIKKCCGNQTCWLLIRHFYILKRTIPTEVLRLIEIVPYKKISCKFTYKKGVPALYRLFLSICTERNFDLCVLRKGATRPQSKFPQSCVCEWFIYFHDRSTYFPAEYADGSFMVI